MDARQVLEVSIKAGKSEIKRAYRHLANQLHPDRNSSADAVERFKLVKEAYEFLTKGISSTGKFYKTPITAPAPSTPPPTEAPGSWWNPTKYYTTIKHVIIPVPLACTFTGGNVLIPRSNYYAYVPPGVQHDSIQRLTAISRDGNSSQQFDAQFELFDPKGFYRIEIIEGAYQLACQVNISIASLLAELPVEIENPDLRAGPIFITFPLNSRGPGILGESDWRINHDKWYRIQNAGLLNQQSRRREVLYVEPKIIFMSLSSERANVLRQLRDKIKIPRGQSYENQDYYAAWCRDGTHR